MLKSLISVDSSDGSEWNFKENSRCFPGINSKQWENVKNWKRRKGMERRKLTGKDKVFNVFNYGVFGLLTLICAYPFYYLIINT